jgi:hypothetical protein
LTDQITGIVSLAGAPQAFQIVKFPRPRGKNVNDEVDIVQKDPFAFAVSFDVQWAHTLLLQSLFNVVSDGLIVARRGSGAD